MMQGGNMGPIRGGPMTTAPITRGPMTTGPIQGWNGPQRGATASTIASIGSATATSSRSVLVVQSTTTRMAPAGLGSQLPAVGSTFMFAATTTAHTGTEIGKDWRAALTGRVNVASTIIPLDNSL
jgi:hypothetical protein